MNPENELSKLREEIEHLKNKLSLLGAGTDGGSSFSKSVKRPAAAPGSIAGLKEAYMIFNEKQTVTQINSKMCDLIGRNKDDIVGKSTLSDLDKLPWAPELLKTLAREAAEAGGAVELEIKKLDVKTGENRHLLFHAESGGSGGSIIAEDVSDKKKIMENFKRYVSPDVIDKMLGMQDDFFKTDRYAMTVLFADLRGFTSMSSKLPAEDVKNIINDYLKEAIGVIDKYGAMLDKIVGDEVMVLIGAPLKCDDHAVRALGVAIEMQKAHNALRDKWKAKGWPAPALGIGVNTGEMVVGNIGCESRVNYTVLGHNVNLAARLCSHAGESEIFLSMNTLDEVKRFAGLHPETDLGKYNFKMAGEIKAKGIDAPVPVAKLLY